MLIKSSRAVFIDRDGVINKKPPEGEYITSKENFYLLENVERAIKILNQNQFLVIIVTNQRGISLGHLTELQLKEIHQYMISLLNKSGAYIDAVFFCPHNEGECTCRKPEIGLFLHAKRCFPSINFGLSFVVGDSFRDIKAGLRIGCKTILITNGSYSALNNKEITPHFTSNSLFNAVNYCILPDKRLDK
ncbi:MAG: D-glycero-alpha-D-manno-heptose-1,7-bisphosphate 7-phosphatase [Candidatus Helarchaeota archaeon]